MRREYVLVVAFLVPAGCAGEEEGDAERPPRDQASQPAPPPDGGTQAGHGADPRQVVVPRDDSTPPAATIVLESASGTPLAKASQPGRQPEAAAKLAQPRLRGTATGRDADGGVARVRISLKELITCQAAGADSTFRRPRVRYFPPPQIERIRSNPGTRLATHVTRTLPLTLGGRCGDGQALAVDGELWAEATNGTGLEAVTPHLHFKWTR